MTLGSTCKANVRWVKLGCSLLNTLMATPDGVRYLSSEDPLLAQIVKSFAQLDPVSQVQLFSFSFSHCTSF